MHAEGNEDGTYKLWSTPEVMLHCEDDGLLVTTMTVCAGAAGCEPAQCSAWNVQACCICLLRGNLLRKCFNLSLMLMMHDVMATLIPWVLHEVRSADRELSKDCSDALSWHCLPQKLRLQNKLAEHYQDRKRASLSTSFQEFWIEGHTILTSSWSERWFPLTKAGRSEHHRQVSVEMEMGPSENKCQSEEHRLAVLGREVHGHRAESRPGDMQASIPSHCCQRRSGVCVCVGGGHRGFVEVEADTDCSNLFFFF